MVGYKGGYKLLWDLAGWSEAGAAIEQPAARRKFNGRRHK